MNILLIGNYPYLKSQSMDSFANILYKGLNSYGHKVKLLKPIPILGRLIPSATGIGKWIGYIDRFFIFPFFLIRTSTWADVVHICDQANSVYVPILKHKPHIVTCHDMLAIRSAYGEFRENTLSITGKIYQKWILSSLGKAQHIVCDSKKTYDDVIRFTRRPKKSITLIYLGLNYSFRPMSKTESKLYLKQLGIDSTCSFFINVGGNYWYKNKEGLLRIFKHLFKRFDDPKPVLILVNQTIDRKLNSIVKRTGIDGFIRFTSKVTTKQLCSLYSTAKGLIFPSLAEGFGWPIIEAQACGCPVFTSGRKPMTEIGGSAAVYFDPLDEISASDIIFEALRQDQKLKLEGYSNASKFSTNTMLIKYNRCYQKQSKRGV